MRGRSPCWPVIALLAAGLAQAQPLPSVTHHPLELKRAPVNFTSRDAAALVTDLERLVRKAGAEVPDAATYADALKNLKRTDCDRDDECLTRLAQLGHTLYALYVEVDLTLAGVVVATGRVVRADGVAMGAPKVVNVRRGNTPFAEVARTAISTLLSDLELGRLPAQRTLKTDAPKVVSPTTSVTPLVVAPQAPPTAAPPQASVSRDASSGLRRYAIVPTIAAGALSVAAGVMYGFAVSLHLRLGSSSWPAGSDPEGDARRGQTLQLASAVTGGVALGAALTALIFYLTGPSNEPAVSGPSAGAPAVSFSW